MEEKTRPDGATREAERDEATAEHKADRPPSGEEESAADRAREEFEDDREKVEEHYQEMTDIGTHAKGEGRID